MDKISLIVPCYNEEAVLEKFYAQVNMISNQMKEQLFEFVFIDDGSNDGSLSIVQKLHEKDERVRFISFSRNFGKEAAILAGLEHVTGDYVVLLDADLQHPPSLIPQMYDVVKHEDYDCAAARRSSREGESKIRASFSRTFYRLMKKISKIDMVQGATDFQLMTRKKVNAILSVKEYNRFTKGIFTWVGFKTKWIPYENIERAAGDTKWSFGSLASYAFSGIIAFSTFPLTLITIIGVILCILSFIAVLAVVVKTLIWGETVAGYPTLVCLLLFLSGIQLFCAGIIGQYLSKTYMETKKRPIYIIGTTEEDC